MKMYFKGLVGIMLFLGIVECNAASVSMNVTDSNILVGEVFTVDVKVVGAVDLFAFGFDEVHDSSWILDSVTVASQFSDDSIFFTDTDVAGSVPFFNSLISGDALLASLNFTANAAGDFQFSIFSDLTDPNEGGFELLSPTFDLDSSVDITINQVPVPVPEPSSLFILSLGLLGIITSKKTLEI